MKTLNGYCEQYQRACSAIEKSYLTRLVLSDDPKQIDQTVQALAQLRRIPPEQAKAMILVGKPDEVKKQLQTYIDAGITHFIIGIRPPYDREGLQRFDRQKAFSGQHSREFQNKLGPKVVVGNMSKRARDMTKTSSVDIATASRTPSIIGPLFW